MKRRLIFFKSQKKIRLWGRLFNLSRQSASHGRIYNKGKGGDHSTINNGIMGTRDSVFLFTSELCKLKINVKLSKK